MSVNIKLKEWQFIFISLMFLNNFCIYIYVIRCAYCCYLGICWCWIYLGIWWCWIYHSRDETQSSSKLWFHSHSNPMNCTIKMAFLSHSWPVFTFITLGKELTTSTPVESIDGKVSNGTPRCPPIKPVSSVLFENIKKFDALLWIHRRALSELLQLLLVVQVNCNRCTLNPHLRCW